MAVTLKVASKSVSTRNTRRFVKQGNRCKDSRRVEIEQTYFPKAPSPMVL